MGAAKVAMQAALGALVVPAAYFSYALSLGPGASSSSAALIGVLVWPLAPGAFLAWRNAGVPRARLAIFVGGAVAGLGLVLITTAWQLFKLGGIADREAAILAVLWLPAAASFLTGVGGLVGHGLAGAPTPALPTPSTSRTVDGRCATCAAALVPHALQCAQCGAWLES